MNSCTKYFKGHATESIRTVLIVVTNDDFIAELLNYKWQTQVELNLRR